MAHTTSAHQIADLFAERAKNLAPPTYGTELTKIVSVSFTYGLADPTLFPHADLADASAAVLAQEAAIALNYGPPSAQLYEQIILRLQAQGIAADRDRVLLGYGSGQILGLLPDVFIEPGDVVIVEGPTFLGVVARFVHAGARLITIPVDELGMDVDALEETLSDLKKQGIRPRFIYTIPTFHNPTGTTMPLFRRQKLVALAAEYGVLVVEDDAYKDLRFQGEAVPSLASLDQEGWVFYVSTFSKIIAPGVRLGWACGDPAIIERLAMFKSEGPVGPFVSHVVGRYCATGKLDAHIQKLITCYQHKCNLLLEAIAAEFPSDIVALQPDGGFFVWCKLPQNISAKALLTACAEHGVSFLPGTRCYANGQGDDAMRLAFSFQPNDKIVEGIATLGRVLRQWQR
ncbi:PLP-dependent aminotransferase family protein [Desmonostoc muscorum LEGE 12446]|uniref:PLP-dependent aminotransferase family protein n=1 Tax=Desmonostoc muscorum LEGE 12446 TaxID=1828758 RepID=A0A8J7AKH5_DESMC|nr:PLP-dependent aminotransferase family protein [Desmonostoc muscorum]MCF2149204.1 PLP-dependent aminotransferase family protein [Desmonostoc muscorum LEGE 12446]